MTRFWIGVACLEHVEKAVSGGFVQANHGKAAPIRRLGVGDRIAYYSPRTAMRAGDPVQAFTAIGYVVDSEVRTAEESADFHPSRRSARFFPARSAPIQPLLGRLSFTRDSPSWGMAFRRGLFEIARGDYGLIAHDMGVDDDPPV